MSEPTVGRPQMPGYGVPAEIAGALPWSWALERLNACRNYFVASVRPDGRPHVMPVWGVMLDDLFCFSTAITSVKSLNLKGDPRCVVTIEDGHESVIVEGTARITELEEIPGFVDAYCEKYGEENRRMMEDGPKWVVHPTVAFAFVEDDTFSTSATRWSFE